MAKKFRVWAKCTSWCYLDVDADSEEDALEIGRETDGGEFIPTEDGDWSTIINPSP